MASQLLKLAMFLMSLTYSSSLGQAITVATETKSSSDKYFQTLNVTGNSFAALMDNSANELGTSHASTEESKVTPEQQTSPSSVATQEVTSKFTSYVMTIGLTMSKDPPPVSSTNRSITDLLNLSAGLPVTSQEDDVTNNHNMPTSSQPSDETVGISTALATKTPKNTSLPTKKPEDISNKERQKIILIAVCIVILILILATTLFIMVRSKRRRGSQSFNSRRRSSNKQDVWAGQVPELGDGKMTQHPMGRENGTAGNKEEAGKEQEMVTFISGEKNDNSVVLLNEIGNGDTMEEKKPLLEDRPHEYEEQEKLLMEEQSPALTVEKDQV
ncbi:uncharacterized protein LOC122944599 [Bufo gargarizans]|uniref:uncharacterized protein LOC122944599 n=1 Tax=Bufo gargarizans TaxID=30331 RepID=UPI001CF2C2A5|nr:uncharacterized protein LOC122944599 [Bufo gargarizans]